MGTVFAIVNQKGGVGKTTTTVNMASYLATFGKATLLVDLDPQGNASSGLGVERANLEACIYNMLIDGVEPGLVIQKTSVANLDVIPSTERLAGAEVELVSIENRETRLRSALQVIRERYDFIFIDCPPSLNLLTVNALAAADEVIIPIQTEYYALEGVSQLVKTINLIQHELNPGLKIGGVVLTMFNSRTLLSEQVADEAKKFFGAKVFRTIIPRNVRLAEAPSFGQPIIFYDPTSTGATAYENLSREVIGNDSY